MDCNDFKSIFKLNLGENCNKKSIPNSLSGWNASIWVNFQEIEFQRLSRQPKTLTRRPKKLSRCPGTTPRRSQDAIKTFHDVPKMRPRRHQDGPRGLGDAPRRAPESPRMLRAFIRRLKTRPNPPRSRPGAIFGIATILERFVGDV